MHHRSRLLLGSMRTGRAFEGGEDRERGRGGEGLVPVARGHHVQGPLLLRGRADQRPVRRHGGALRLGDQLESAGDRGEGVRQGRSGGGGRAQAAEDRGPSGFREGHVRERPRRRSARQVPSGERARRGPSRLSSGNGRSP